MTLDLYETSKSIIYILSIWGKEHILQFNQTREAFLGSMFSQFGAKVSAYRIVGLSNCRTIEPLDTAGDPQAAKAVS